MMESEADSRRRESMADSEGTDEEVSTIGTNGIG